MGETKDLVFIQCSSLFSGRECALFLFNALLFGETRGLGFHSMFLFFSAQYFSTLQCISSGLVPANVFCLLRLLRSNDLTQIVYEAFQVSTTH